MELGEASLASLARELGAVVERVEVAEPPRAVGCANEEVTRHPDSFDGDAHATTDFDHDHAQRDRDAEATGEDVVEIGVAGVAVVDPVPGEAELDEQVAGERTRLRWGRVGEIVESTDPGVDVEAGVGVGCDEQAGFTGRHRRLRSGQELGEPGRRILDRHGATVPAARRTATSDDDGRRAGTVGRWQSVVSRHRPGTVPTAS